MNVFTNIIKIQDTASERCWRMAVSQWSIKLDAKLQLLLKVWSCKDASVLWMLLALWSGCEFTHGDEFLSEMKFKQLLISSLYTSSPLYSLG